MTTFNQIYHEVHEYIDGTIEIANSTSNLSKAYIVVDTINIEDKLEQPLLIGFLYQVDSSGKRSKPYPVVSLRQTINLDISECTQFLFVLVNRLISAYDLLLFVSTESGGSSSVDLSGYALLTDLPDLSSYALISQLPDLTDYALKSELPTGGSSDGFIAVSTNSTLESNKKYLATASGLVCALPSSPSIGDKIALATGNFSFRVNHGNGSQSILNLSTQSTVGTDSGIILKPYSSIELFYLGSNLWVSSFRSRTINNWTPETIESTSSVKSYTASFYNSGSTAYGTSINNIKNGVLAPTGSYGNDGLLLDNSLTQILVTFSQPVNLTSFDFYGGQGNEPLGSANNGYKVDSISIYGGNDTSNLLSTVSPTNSNGTQQTFTVDTSGLAFSQYIFSFSRSGTGIGIMELILTGRGQTGGEALAS